MFVGRVIYDLLFFFVVIIIVLNLIFGVIIDTFADLRSEKQNKDEILKNTCFICGKFDEGKIRFSKHIRCRSSPKNNHFSVSYQGSKLPNQKKAMSKAQFSRRTFVASNLIVFEASGLENAESYFNYKTSALLLSNRKQYVLSLVCIGPLVSRKTLLNLKCN